jgi:serine/threonine protein kinase
MSERTFSSTANTDFVAGRYELLSLVGRGGMGEVYRALDHFTGDTIALKTLAQSTTPNSSADHSPSSDPRLALAREFRTLARLRHPHIISVLDYGFTRQKIPFFTMELVENASSVTDYSRHGDMQLRARLLLEMFQALMYLHHRGVLHRDLKPANLLVTPEGKLKVTDFGLSKDREGKQRGKGGELEGDIIGTIGYMAPELFQGRASSIRTDLYAAGLVAYEVLTGAHPLDPGDILAMMCVQTTIDFSMLPLALRVIVARLTDPRPDNRYGGVGEFLDAFCAATNLPAPTQDRETLDSYLTTPAFVGRNNELHLLTNALTQAKQGRGSGWLVGGEKGVGKTRLLDEVRIRALVDGARVLRVDCQDLVMLYPYHLWREVVRALALTTPLSEDERTVLSIVLPSLDPRRQRPYSRRDPNPEHTIVLLAATLHSVIARQTEPLVLLLEGLDRMDESLDVLNELVRLSQHTHLLVVGSYRSDETTRIAERVSHLQRLPLERLSSEEIRQISINILGRAGDQLIHLIERETEGNAYFIVEILRTLADSSGNLSAVSQTPVPTRVVSDAINNSVKRRLQKLPLDYQTMLRLAAVIGRDVDTALLKTVDDELDYDDWLTKWANAAVLELQDGIWRFTHDQVRAAVLDGLENAYLRRLNSMAAEAIEAVYPDNPAYFAVLAGRWRDAGEFGKMVGYIEALIEIFLQRGLSHGNARALLEQALELVRGKAEYTSQRLTLKRLLAGVIRATGNLTEAVTVYRQALTLAQETSNRTAEADILFQMSQAQQRQGDYGAAKDSLEQALLLYEKLNDSLGQAIVGCDLGRVFDLIGADERALTCYEDSLAIAREQQHPDAIATALLAMGDLALKRRDFSHARQRYEDCARLATQLEDREKLSHTSNALALVLLFTGDIGEAQTEAERSLQLAQAARDTFAESFALSCLCNITQHQGDDAAYETYAGQLLRLSLQSGARPRLSEAMMHKAMSHLRDRAFDEAAALLHEALTLANNLEAALPQQIAIRCAVYCAALHGDHRQAARWSGAVHRQWIEAVIPFSYLDKVLTTVERRFASHEYQRLVAEGAAQGSRMTILEILSYYAAFEPVEY